MSFSLNSAIDEDPKVPHEKHYRAGVKRMSSSQVDDVFKELNRLIDKDEIHTSSWMSGCSDWADTPFDPIYIHGAGRRVSLVSLSGPLSWIIPDNWGFGRYEKDGVPIHGITYFRIDSSKLMDG